MRGLVFSFLLAVAVRRISGQGCLYEGRVYQQGERWTVPCQYDCVCDDATTGHYTCTSVCLTYDNLPPGCFMQAPPPGECCGHPQCGVGKRDFISRRDTMTGTGTGTVSQRRFRRQETCVDKLPHCADYGLTVCTDQQYREWAKENCALFCGLCRLFAECLGILGCLLG